MENSRQTDKQPVARLMLDAFRGFESELVNRLQQVGFDDIRMHHLNLLRHLNPEGMRLVDLARDAGISKQAAGQFCQKLAGSGYVQIDSNPQDRREKIVSYTPKGQAFLQAAYQHVTQIEQHVHEALGNARYRALEAALKCYINTINNDHNGNGGKDDAAD